MGCMLEVVSYNESTAQRFESIAAAAKKLEWCRSAQIVSKNTSNQNPITINIMQ